MDAGQIAMVCGTRNGMPGDQVQAKLIKPLLEGSEYWWVQISGDRDETGKQITRIRQILS